jgi:hypothetical protein
LVFKSILVFTLFFNFGFANPFADDEEDYAEYHEYRLSQKTSAIDNTIDEVDGLIDNNLNCVNGTELMIQNRVCYQTFLAIKKVIDDGKAVNALSEILMRECPEVYNFWAEFEEIKLCK